MRTHLFRLSGVLLLAALGLEVAFAGDTTVSLPKSDYTFGEIVWIGEEKPVEMTVRVTRRELELASQQASIGGEPGVSVSRLKGAGASTSVGTLSWPTTHGLTGGLAATVLGDLRLSYPGETVVWHRDESAIAGAPGSKWTKRYRYSRSAGGLTYSEALFHGPMVRRWTDLLKGNDEAADLRLSGEARIAVYCAAEHCRVPKEVGPIEAEVFINTPLTASHQTRRSIGTDSRKVTFRVTSSCTFTVDPVEHAVGTISLHGRQPVPSLISRDYVTRFSVRCGDNDSRRAQAIFGTFWPVSYRQTPRGMRFNSLARTNLDGIGIVYSTDEITNCREAMSYFQKLPVGPGRYGQFKKSASKDFHFALCTYRPRVETGELRGTVYYNFWLD